jgi:hypothetical protein
MPFIDKLPPTLEDGEALCRRRAKAAERKSHWRSLYRDAYRFAMPARENFDFVVPGEFKNSVLYDSTLQDATYAAANTAVALLCPPWQRWTKLAPGAEFPKDQITQEVMQGMREITEIFFEFLNGSNFYTVIHESMLDLEVGTAALRFDEGKSNSNPFIFSATPLAAIELEEGPKGSVETIWMQRQPLARNLTRMYENMELFDLPEELQDFIRNKPDDKVEIIQGTVFDPDDENYYGVVIWEKSKTIIWRFKFGLSSPDIVARATKLSGELYGRGRVLMALADARTLDKMQEFVLRHSALQVAPPMTGVSDGVMNPFTAVLAPNTILPVASNDSRNPSLSPITFGGNFQITDAIMSDLRERIRRTMLGPEPSEGPVTSATEQSIRDRNRLWSLGGEFGRIQVELLVKVVTRGLFILQRRGLIPAFKVDGREVRLQFTSPFARSQDAEDLLALDRSLDSLAPFQGAAQVGYDIDMLPEWVAAKTGLDPVLVNDKTKRKKLKKEAAEAAVQLAQQQAALGGGGPQGSVNG